MEIKISSKKVGAKYYRIKKHSYGAIDRCNSWRSDGSEYLQEMIIDDRRYTLYLKRENVEKLVKDLSDFLKRTEGKI